MYVIQKGCVTNLFYNHNNNKDERGKYKWLQIGSKYQYWLRRQRGWWPGFEPNGTQYWHNGDLRGWDYIPTLNRFLLQQLSGLAAIGMIVVCVLFCTAPGFESFEPYPPAGWLTLSTDVIDGTRSGLTPNSDGIEKGGQRWDRAASTAHFDGEEMHGPPCKLAALDKGFVLPAFPFMGLEHVLLERNCQLL